MTAKHTTMDTPVGELTVVADENGIVTGLYFPHHWTKPDRTAFGSRDDLAFDEVTAQMKEYFAGARRTFDLPTRAEGDEFQHRVWAEIAKIPYGSTATYGDIAAALHDPSSARAVGAAVGRNPLSFLVACHRVVGKDGALTGYSGGFKRKQYLLELEQPPAVDRGQLW